MGQLWQDCIVCYFDLNGTKAVAAVPGAGSKLMRQLHALVVERVKSGLKSVAHAYTWNDSVLLLFHVGKDSSAYATAMKQADEFKSAVDAMWPCHAIAVKGQTFPRPKVPLQSSGRVTVLEASSWAMGNCFEIEIALKSEQAEWCVDRRIVSKLSGIAPSKKHKIVLFPYPKHRVVHSFNSYLWPIDSAERRGSAGDRLPIANEQ